MAKKKKYKKGYTTGGRVDMRNGGRVAMRTGANPQMATDERIAKRTYGPDPLEGSQEQTIPRLTTTPSPRPPASGPAPQVPIGPRVGNRPTGGDVFPDLTSPAPADATQRPPQTQIAGEPETVVTPQPKLFDFDPSQVVDIEKIKRDAADRAQQNLEPQTGPLINPATNEEWAWVSAGYDNVQDALAAGWTYDQNLGDFVPPTSTPICIFTP